LKVILMEAPAEPIFSSSFISFESNINGGSRENRCVTVHQSFDTLVFNHYNTNILFTILNRKLQVRLICELHHTTSFLTSFQ
jgi:hypothetical protein